ncbi:hypothetical protein [Burkholderia plantarii]|uniref:hypothetical protein n=1 Tax=Burkholderia plantarii TaxID=41899 RepID=UPI0006D8B1E3|nr:hypothetical protein [Burkholderia plantarii]ALK30466.1 Putative bacteriophage protein [Burkholderia plantarii]GLZ19860.1 hypothetical protein Bpla01_33890 [Burkholderia plantarii]
MLYRKLDADGDYTFGGGMNDFLEDTPEAVAQAVLTRLRLLRGEWFLDTTAGMPWAGAVLGKNTQGTADAAVRACILDTLGVTEIAAYASEIDAATRTLRVTARIGTIYGTTNTTLEAIL